MSDAQTRIAQLERELARLAEANTQQRRSLILIQAELQQLKAASGLGQGSVARPAGPPPLPVSAPGVPQSKVFSYKSNVPVQPVVPPTPPKPKAPRTPSQLEKYIGENLLPVVAIAILILGVSYGVIDAIEKDLISPTIRIVLGYFVGIGLLGFAERLRTKYNGFSAVLLGGGMAVLYFITYIAYDFYDLIPQGVAFGLMVVFTAFTALAAIRYDRQIIALLGLVGAYAVPFLLSSGSGNTLFLLSYVALVNVGILIVSFQRNWRILLYISFILSWLILAITIFASEASFAQLISFATVFFLTFYAMAVVPPWLRKEQVRTSDIILLVANAAIFFGLGYFLFDEQEEMGTWLGAFTLANAGVHLLIGMLMQKRGVTKGNLQPLLAGLALVFVVIAIPVQLDGNYVTMIWATLAALLLWMSQRAEVPAVRWFAYPLFLLAFVSLMDDLESAQRAISYAFNDDVSPSYRPFFNQLFLAGGVVAAAFGIATWLSYRRELTSKLIIDQIIRVAFPLATLILLYSMFFQEINLFFEAKFQASKTLDMGVTDYDYFTYDYYIQDLKMVWASIYSLLFAVLVLLGYLRFGSKTETEGRLNWLALIALGVGVLAAVHFLVGGLYSLSELREAFLEPGSDNVYPRETLYSGLRYLGIALLGGLLVLLKKAFTQQGYASLFTRIAEIVFHVAILWVLTSELLHWMDIQGSQNQYKLGVSILWGVYSVVLVALGIWRGGAHLRIAAIALFTATLLKLFAYDLSSLDTIGKTIVFVVLGVLLLIISFLYTKYKDRIGSTPEA
ncbi:MAG: DUF2339 domain-containing protein [Saprospiraceae bacterium]